MSGTIKDVTKDIIIQNIKLVKIMKSCNYTDKEICEQLGISIKDFVEIIYEDEYLKSVYEQAQEKLANDIEREFLDQMIKKLENGDTTDAKWVLERTHKKYQKKEQLDVNVKSIDDIIRGE